MDASHPAYITSTERFGNTVKHINDKVQFQRDEKDKRDRLKEGKAQTLRAN
jgi:hypothetical protein